MLHFISSFLMYYHSTVTIYVIQTYPSSTVFTIALCDFIRFRINISPLDFWQDYFTTNLASMQASAYTRK